MWSPSLVVLLAALSLAACVMARTDPVLLNGDHLAGTARITLSDAVVVALLQGSTIIGVAVCGIAGATLATGMLGQRGYERMIDLVGGRMRRTVLQLSTVLLVLVAWLVITSVAIAATVVIQTTRLGLSVTVDLGSVGALVDDLAKAGLVAVIFASMAVAVGLALARTPLVATIALVGGAFALMLVEQLAESLFSSVVPTAWVAELLQLPMARFGTAYYWTTGATGGTRSVIWVLMFVLALAAWWALWLQNRRLESG